MKEALNKLAAIVDGNKNLLKHKLGISNEKDEEVFAARREVCNACPFRSATDKCIKCGCPLEAKTRTYKTNCPEGYWKTIKDDNTN
jgi:hypothetical protein